MDTNRVKAKFTHKMKEKNAYIYEDRYVFDFKKKKKNYPRDRQKMSKKKNQNHIVIFLSRLHAHFSLNFR